MKNKFESFLADTLNVAASAVISFFIGSLLLIFLDKIALDDFFFKKKPGYKNDVQLSYETFKSTIHSNCDAVAEDLVRKTDGKGPIPKFEHYKCGAIDYVWAREETVLSLAIYKDEPSWLIGN